MPICSPGSSRHRIVRRSRARGRWYTAAASLLFVACSTSENIQNTVDEGASTSVAADSAPALVVTEHGLGELRVGMSLAEARALPEGLVEPGRADSSGCHYVGWRGAPPGVRVMIDGGVVGRVDVDSTALATAAGARIGDSQARIDSLYAGRVAVTPHKYTSGRYLTVGAASPADSAYRIIFETDSAGSVLRYRAGSLPAVEYVEGCG